MKIRKLVQKLLERGEGPTYGHNLFSLGSKNMIIRTYAPLQHNDFWTKTSLAVWRQLQEILAWDKP
jgi:hypothetical protein